MSVKYRMIGRLQIENFKIYRLKGKLIHEHLLLLEWVSWIDAMFISILCTVRNSLTIKRARKVNSMIINEFPDVDGNDFSTFSFLLYQLCKRIE